MDDTWPETERSQLEDISFPCEGRCRICPFPGANCSQEQMHTDRQSEPKKTESQTKSRKV